MATIDINQIVLDAFRVEHREQLEQIRALLDSLAHGEDAGHDVGHDARLTEAFRLAHSFKGGARVCDLRDAERLGHGLETVLEQLNRGQLPLTDNVGATMTLLLDTIEDWMAALDAEQPLPDTSAALAAVDQVLAGHCIARSFALDGRQNESLRAVFRTEYAQQAGRLRALLAEWSAGGSRPDEKQLAEAIRIAHTLSGAAAIVEMPAVESSARSLETLFQAIRRIERCFDAQAQRQIESWLDAADKVMAMPGKASSEPAPPREHESTGAIPASRDTVRISIDSLERLTRSSGQLLVDLERLGRFTRQLDEFQHEVRGLECQREAMRRGALSSRLKHAALPELEQVAEHLELVDRQVGMLARRARQLSVEQRRTEWLLRGRGANIVHGIHEARMVPAHSVFHGFRKLIRDLARSEEKEIEFVANGLDARADRMVLQDLKDPLMHVLRNCVTHGVETPQVRLAKGMPAGSRVTLNLEIVDGRLVIVVEDDGCGIDVEQIRRRAIERGLITAAAAEQQSADDLLSVLLQPGFSTLETATELAGRGMGLSIVQTTVARLQGQLKLERGSGGGLRVALSVPCTVSTHRVLLVTCAGQTLAIPARQIERLLRVPADKLETLEGRPVITYRRCPIHLKSLAGLLGIAEPTGNPSPSPSPLGEELGQGRVIYTVLLKAGARLMAVSVDALREERDALIQPLDEFADASQFAGCILLEDGRIALVVQPGELWDRVQPGTVSVASTAPPSDTTAAAPTKILIVDDSFTTRTLEKNILEAYGYRVGVAVDGVEALAQLRQQRFAAVISDIEMPRMDGFSLLEQIKSDRRLAGTPVILVTSRDRQEDQRRGLDLGAEAYIVKRKFDHQELLNVIRQLVSPRAERRLEWTPSA
jgi:two-component system chemotaxis sensor kinase CheA